MEVAANFPEECRYVLEMLGEVYRYDAEAREGGLTAEERLQLHQQHSQPVMEKLHSWLEAQFAERKTEPNSGLGQGNHVSVAALESLDDVFAGGGSASGQ